MPYDLQDRKVLVTAGSRGLGAVISTKFADQGCHVAINYNSRPEPAEEIVTHIREKHAGDGRKIVVLQGVSL